MPIVIQKGLDSGVVAVCRCPDVCMHMTISIHASVWLIVLPYTIRSSGPARFAAPSGDEVQRLLSVVVVKGEDVNPLVIFT